MSPRSILMLAMAANAFAQTRLVNSIGNFIHDVSDLDRSVRFYRDVVGMEVPRPPGDWQTGEGVLKMYDAAGGKYRVANAQIPGSPMRVEMVEFQGVDRKPARRPWGAAGTSVLMLTVADLTPVEERVKSASITPLVKLKKACDGRGLVIADPDGFAVLLMERSGQAPLSAPPKSNFTSLRFGYLVSGDALAKGPMAALGLPTSTQTHICQPIEDALLSGPGNVVTVPGGFEIRLVKGKAQKTPVPVRPHDPGAAVLRFAVSDVDAAVQALKQAQLTIASAGGVVQTLPPAGLRAVIFHAPDSLFIQVVK